MTAITGASEMAGVLPLLWLSQSSDCVCHFPLQTRSKCKKMQQSSQLSFKALTTGASFDRLRFKDDVRLFTAGHAAASPVAHTSGGIGDASTSIPPPATATSLFSNNSETEKTEGSAAEEAAAVGQSTTTVVRVSRKRMHHLWKRSGMSVKGTDIPQPLEHFCHLSRPPFNVPVYLTDNLFARNHRIPTPIQMQAIPCLLKRQDVIACAPTGSGKTIAFLIPLFALLAEPNPECGIRALIVSPTKELAMQIEREAFFLMKGKRWKFVQHGQTTKNKDIFVTTPSRAWQMIKDGLVSVDKVEYVVLDEGDKLLDVQTDFVGVIDKILAACTNKSKVTSLFSATLADRVEAAARSIMCDPVRIIVNHRTAANKNVEQKLFFVGNELGKIIAVRNMIREGLKPPVLIFVQSIERTKELLEEIQTAGLHVAVMNSKMTGEERDETVMQFRLGNVWVLITTDLLARGMDFKGVGTVINFDLPLTAESYVHRVGRTGRAGKKGFAITFYTEEDKERLPAFVKLVQNSGGVVDEWLTKLKGPSKKRKRQLRTTAPQRMIVSTQKRILVGQQRIERQLRRMEEESGTGKRQRDDSGIEEDDEDDASSGGDIE